MPRPTFLTKNINNGHLPHEIGKVPGGDVAFAGSVESLEGGVGFEGLGLAQVLSAKFDSLLALPRVRQNFSQLFLSRYRHFLSLHHLECV